MTLAWFGFWVFLAVVLYAAHIQYMAGHDTLFFTHKTDAEKALRDNVVIRLTPAEIQSGVTRVNWAEDLIRELPGDHYGRNAWLLVYGKRDGEDMI